MVHVEKFYDSVRREQKLHLHLKFARRRFIRGQSLLKGVEGHERVIWSLIAGLYSDLLKPPRLVSKTWEIPALLTFVGFRLPESREKLLS